jgi:hypothetical protein
MTSDEQALEANRETAATMERSVDTDRERPNLPDLTGNPISPKDESTHRTGGSLGPATLFAKVVGIRR